MRTKFIIPMQSGRNYSGNNGILLNAFDSCGERCSSDKLSTERKFCESVFSDKPKMHTEYSIKLYHNIKLIFKRKSMYFFLCTLRVMIRAYLHMLPVYRKANSKRIIQLSRRDSY